MAEQRACTVAAETATKALKQAAQQLGTALHAVTEMQRVLASEAPGVQARCQRMQD